MSLFKLNLRPGVFRESSRYSSEGTWYDCDKVRFQKGFPHKIGGWVKYASGSILGTARKLHDWVTILGSRYIGVGTTYKLYINEGSEYHDITPIRSTVTLGTDPIDTVDGTALITVNHTAHGAIKNDYVTISGANAVGGIVADSINKEHRIVSTPDADSFQVVCDTAATSTVSGGGSAVVAEYQINRGLDTYLSASGWGSGSWGSGSWGSGSAVSASNQLRLWSIDNYGDDMIANVRQGGIYYWDQTNGVSTRAIPIHELIRRTLTLTTDPVATTNTSNTLTITDTGGHGAGPGDTVTLSGSSAVNGVPADEINTSHTILTTPTNTTFTIQVSTSATSTGVGGGSSVVATYQAGQYNTPTSALQVMTSPSARQVIAFGSNAIGDTVVDPLFVRWSTSENPAEWEPRPENSAGGQRLSAGSVFIGAARTRQEIIIWTDAGMTSMRYSGQPFIYQFTEIATGISMISPNAYVVTHGSVFFMDRGAFYRYDGSVTRLNCTVRDYIFNDLDYNNLYKIHTGSNSDHSEVMWFYPCINGGGCLTKYVMYNHYEDKWSFGTMKRAAWTEAPTKDSPVASGIRRDTLGTDPLSITSAGTTLTVTQTDHRAIAGDTVILSGSPTIGGVASEIINSQHVIATVVDDDTFTIELPDAATSTETGGGSAVMAEHQNYLFSHEIGHDDDGYAMSAYIESSEFDIGDGDQFWFIGKIMPDIEFVDSEDVADTVTITIKGADHYGTADRTIATASVTSTNDQCFVRGRARSLIYRIESSGSGYGWRVGHSRIDGRTDGRR